MLIDGRSIAQNINLRTKQKVNQLTFRPLLVDIMVGEDPACLSYVKIKEKKAHEAGLDFELVKFPMTVATEEVISEIKNFATREKLSGLIVQLPLPKSLDSAAILDSIPSKVDVDLLSSETSAQYYSGISKLIPPTAGAIMEIIESLPEDWSEKQILVLGQGDLVGKPITYLLQQKGWRVTTADSSTPDVNTQIALADCIISGIGQAGFLTGDKIKQDAIVIDAGTSEANGSVSGDADAESVGAKAKYLTPVPGGVGPVTVAKLLENTLVVAQGNK